MGCSPVGDVSDDDESIERERVLRVMVHQPGIRDTEGGPYVFMIPNLLLEIVLVMD